MGNINISVDDELHKQFKIKCIENDKEMREVIQELMSIYIKKQKEVIDNGI